MRLRVFGAFYELGLVSGTVQVPCAKNKRGEAFFEREREREREKLLVHHMSNIIHIRGDKKIRAFI